MMNTIIRKEEQNDFDAVFRLIREAFENEQQSDHQEQFLVARLRNSDAFVPELSMVAEDDGKIVGHILLTKISITGGRCGSVVSLALAPVSVLPEYQGRGIGGQLIRAAHEKAKEMGFGSVVLLGHAPYYPRFGYRLAKEYGIRLPFDVPDENCMVLELSEGSLKDVTGVVEYPKAFFE